MKRKVKRSGRKGQVPRLKTKSPTAARASSPVDGITWPIIQSNQEAYALALQYQLQDSQWWDQDILLRHQLLQVQNLIDHAVEQVPFYRQRLKSFFGLMPGALTLEQFQQIPSITREEIQAAGPKLRARTLPRGHGSVEASKTSGSTGKPIHFQVTTMTSMMQAAMTMRGHIWHQRDLGQKSISLRTPRSNMPAGKQARWAVIAKTGPGLVLDMRLPINDLFEKVAAENPAYLQSHPYIIYCLALRAEETGVRLGNLREVRTYGETVEPHVREKCQAVWGVPLRDNYSAEEFGIIAHQCPISENLHVQSENVLLEVLDENDKPCAPGEMGRTVITSLNNFATPFIRSDIADFAIVGAPCECGRGLPVLERVFGRARNFILRPSGERIFPNVANEMGAVEPVRQFQLVQTSIEVIEMNLKVARALTQAEETGLKKAINQNFGYDFELPIKYVDDIPREASGKFREIHSELTSIG